MKVSELLEQMGYWIDETKYDYTIRDMRQTGGKTWEWKNRGGIISATDARILNNNTDKELEHYTIVGSFFGVFAYKIRGGMACFSVNKMNYGYQIIRLDNWRKEKFVELQEQLKKPDLKVITATTPIFMAWGVMEQIDG